MSKNRWLIVLGLIVAITPFLGFPLKFKDFLLVILGLSIVYLSFRMTKIKPCLKTDNGIFMDSEKSESKFEENEEIEKLEKSSVSNDLKEKDGNPQKLLNDQENQQV